MRWESTTGFQTLIYRIADRQRDEYEVDEDWD